MAQDANMPLSRAAMPGRSAAPLFVVRRSSRLRDGAPGFHATLPQLITGRLQSMVSLLSNLLENLLVAGDAPANPTIGIHDAGFHGYLEDAAVSLFQVGYDAEFLLNGSRQTGGWIKEASLYTIGDFDLCRFPSFCCLAHGSLLFTHIQNI